MSAGAVTQAEKAGAAPYSRALLSVYDTVVLRWSNTLVWRCPSERLLAHYNTHLGARHLDIGPGTGWYLQHATYPTPNPTIELLDLNPNTLQMTTTRLTDRGITAAAHTGSILAPLPADIGVFDSVAANFVLHCVPGTWEQKGRAFGHIAQAMADDGVFFGSTILDTGVHHTPLKPRPEQPLQQADHAVPQPRRRPRRSAHGPGRVVRGGRDHRRRLCRGLRRPPAAAPGQLMRRGSAGRTR